MNNQKILLIDYDPASISRTATPLTKAGYEVEVAKDGLSGLAAFERSKPALVLVEAMLPRKHGFEVCQEIKEKPEGKSTPVLITTAVCRGRKYRMDALQIYGCDEYIEKPITDDELVGMISRFIDAANEARENVKQELSEAIDSAPSPVPADIPTAIESMDDDELEAKIDSLLMGVDGPGEDEEILAPPKPAVEQPAAVASAAPPATERAVEETETDGGLDGMLQVEPEAIDQPVAAAAAPPLAEELPSAEPAVEQPAAEAKAVPRAGTEPAPPQPLGITQELQDPLVADSGPEWTGTSEKKAFPKLALIGVAAVVVLGVVGFFAFRTGSGEDATVNEPAQALALQAPAPETFAPPLRPPVTAPAGELETPAGAAAAEPADVAVEAQPEPSPPKPVVPPKPTYKAPSASEKRERSQRQASADRALSEAAGSLQSELLSGQVAEPALVEDASTEVAAVDDASIGTPVRPKARLGELFDIEDVDVAPRPERFEQPVYDEMARRSNQQGVVIVEVLVDETGNVTEARLLQEIPKSRLNDATLRAARRWTYRPAIKDGVRVKVWKTERIVFELE